MAKADGDTSQWPRSLLAQQNALPSLPPPFDNSPQSDLVPQSEGNMLGSQPPPADDKQAITVPPISSSQSSGLSKSKGVSKSLPDVPPTQALQQTGGDTSPGFPGAEEPGGMTQSLSHTDSSHTHVHSNSNSTGSNAVPGTRPATWTDSKILTSSPQPLPLSVPEAQIDLQVVQREGDILPGPVTLSESTQASELSHSPDKQGYINPSGKIAQDLSQPVVVNNAHPLSMIQSPVEQVNDSPKIAKRNTSNDSTSSSRPSGFHTTVGNPESPQAVASAERESEATEIPPAPPESHDPPIENQRAGGPHPRSRSSSIGDAGEGSQGQSRGKPSQEGGEDTLQQGEGHAPASGGEGTPPPGGRDTSSAGGIAPSAGGGPPLAPPGGGSAPQPGRGRAPPLRGEGTPPRHNKEGAMDGTGLSPKKKRGLLSII